MNKFLHLAILSVCNLRCVNYYKEEIKLNKDKIQKRVKNKRNSKLQRQSPLKMADADDDR